MKTVIQNQNQQKASIYFKLEKVILYIRYQDFQGRNLIISICNGFNNKRSRSYLCSIDVKIYF